MKRAATITVYTLLREDPPHWQTDADNTASLFDGTAEQLLADLRDAARACEYEADTCWGYEHLRERGDHFQAVARRVRALLPKEDDDG